MIRKKIDMFILINKTSEKSPLEVYDIVTANIERSTFTSPNFISAVEFSNGYLNRFNKFGNNIKRIKKTEL